ncbi:MAG: hypothetical protein V1854_03305, partial [Methanobacteriota archaeon]
MGKASEIAGLHKRLFMYKLQKIDSSIESAL